MLEKILNKEIKGIVTKKVTANNLLCGDFPVYEIANGDKRLICLFSSNTSDFNIGSPITIYVSRFDYINFNPLKIKNRDTNKKQTLYLVNNYKLN